MSLKKIHHILICILISTSCFSQWQVVSSNTTQNLVDGCFVNDSTGFIISSNGLILKTTNKGNSWSQNATLSGVFTSICKVNKDTLFAGGNCIYKSYNGGITWNLVTSLPYTITDLVFFTAKNGYMIVPSFTSCTWGGGTVISENFQMHQSVDFGTSWQYVTSGFGHTSYFDVLNDSTAIVPRGYIATGMWCNSGGFEVAIKTKNRGSSWSVVNQPVNGHPYISFINDSVGYYIQAGLPYIRKTTNGGTNMFSIGINIADTALRQCKFLNDNHGYLLSEHLVYKTGSGGNYWINDYTTSDNLNYLFRNTDSVLIGLGSNGLIIKKTALVSAPPDTIKRVALNKSLLDFGDVIINSVSEQTVNIQNTGNFPINLSITSSNDFKISFTHSGYVDSLNVTLNSLQSKPIYVQFNPLLVQNYQDSLRVKASGVYKSIPIRGNSYNALSGYIATDTLICVDTLRIMGDVWILPTAKVTICAGTFVQMLGNYQIVVQGVLKALGTVSDSITFSAKNPNLLWKGVLLSSQISNDTTTLNYCKLIEKCNNPCITSKGGRLLINHCIIRNPKNGIGAILSSHQYGNALNRQNILNSEISNTPADAIFCANCDSTYIFNNKFFNNQKAIVAQSSGANFYIKNNEIYNNSGEGIFGTGTAIIQGNKIYDNAGGINFGQASVHIENNEVYNNRSAQCGGIKISVQGNPSTITQNLIFNNSTINSPGAGIKAEPGWYPPNSLSLMNNTICNNKNENEGVGNNFHVYSLHLNLFNNIIFSSIDATNNLLWNPNVTDTVNNNCLNQSNLSILGQNNFANNPEFVMPTSTSGVVIPIGSYDWSLKPISRCIESGDSLNTTFLPLYDYAGNARIYNTRVDIGAYEFQGQGTYDAIEEKEYQKSFHISPNPFSDELKITTDLAGESEIKLYNVTSTLVLHLKFKNQHFLNTEQLAKGIYIYEIINSSGKSEKGKLIKQ